MTTAWVISSGAWGWQIWRIVDADVPALDAAADAASAHGEDIYVTNDQEEADAAQEEPGDGSIKDASQEAMTAALWAHAADPTGDALARV